MKFEEIKNAEWFVWLSPNGVPQPGTLSPDLHACFAYMQLLHKYGLADSPAEMTGQGWRVFPVKLSIEINENPTLK